MQYALLNDAFLRDPGISRKLKKKNTRKTGTKKKETAFSTASNL